jgi:small subunit ribosomal protein S6
VRAVRTYETLFITNPTLTDDEEKAAVDALAQVVTDTGGTFAVRERLGRRRLAYPIKKFEDGVYTRFLYDSDAAVPKELDRRLRINDKVIRHMTVYMDPEWAQFSKEQAVRDAAARAEADAAREAGLLPPDEIIVPASADDTPRRPRRDDRADDEFIEGGEDE